MGRCADPSILEGLNWLACYLTTGKHLAFYTSFFTVIAFLIAVAFLALAIGTLAALAKRSRFFPLSWLATGYASVVRGVPELVFFLFFPIAIDQAIEWTRHKIICPHVTEPIRRGAEFVVCDAAKLPLTTAPEFAHDIYGILLALISFAFVYGAFAANVIDGAMHAVPRGQIEAAQAVGMRPRQILTRVHLPQMWVYALPGLSNVWQVLVKSTPLLFFFGIEDVVYWARELGGMKTSAFDYPHPDWRAYYFGVLMVFYLTLTWTSQVGFARLTTRLRRGQPMADAI